MLKLFSEQLETLNIKVSEKILLAVSGGLDSMTMLHMFKATNKDFGVAHVNFGLRGKDSDLDEELVRNICSKWDIPFYVYRPDTAATAKENGNSIQMEARNLRYAFFNSICTEFGYDKIVTAHHKNDAIENFFIYILRNNAKAALSGIAPKNENIVRPMLVFTRQELNGYATLNTIEWREDSSNLKSDYVRNKIRNIIIPGLLHEYPAVLEDYSELAALFRLNEKKNYLLFLKVLNTFSKTEISGDILLPYKIQKHIDLEPFMQWYLRPYGFSKSTIDQISKTQIPGKMFIGNEYSINTERNAWRMRTRSSLNKRMNVHLLQTDLPFYLDTQNINLEISIKENLGQGIEKDQYYFDIQGIHFPLVLRFWETGDRIQVFGMQGHKKLSDIFIDSKVEQNEKMNYPILCDNTSIIAVPGLRRSDAARVENNTKQMLCVHWVRKEKQID